MAHAPQGSPDLPIFDHPDHHFDGELIVTVHGMGDQTRNDFAQSVARLFSRSFASEENPGNQTATLPLGAWDSGQETPVDDQPIRFLPSANTNDKLGNYAFAEIFWADVARTFEDEKYRLEEPTHWARTVVERLAQRFGAQTDLAPESFHLAGFVVEEIAETLSLIGKFAALGKLGNFKKEQFDSILIKYLCDVQQVADFVRQREKFRLRFIYRLQALHRQCPKAKIHLVAHSEGAAITLFTLLSAMKTGEQNKLQAYYQQQKFAPVCKYPGDIKVTLLDFSWLDQIHSLTTLGAPIDKHICLWPEMWGAFRAATPWVPLARKIRWRNYYDYADPVGYELDIAREKLVDGRTREQKKADLEHRRQPALKGEWGCEAFEFPEDGDYGFRRYLLLGKAHLDYFSDVPLFAYLIRDSVQGIHEPAKAPTGTFSGQLCRIIPFALVTVLMVGAVFVFHRGLVGEHPQINYARAQEILGKDAAALSESWESSAGIIGCSALLLGTTVLARILRLTRSADMWAFAGACYAVGAAIFWVLPGYFTLEAAYHGGASIIADIVAPHQPAATICRLWFILLTVLIVAIAWIADYLAAKWKWRPIWGLRILIASAAAFLFAFLVFPRLGDSGNTSALALISGWAAFIGLWWAATLLFDLSFCWYRYINSTRSWLDRIRPAAEEEC